MRLYLPIDPAELLTKSCCQGIYPKVPAIWYGLSRDDMQSFCEFDLALISNHLFSVNKTRTDIKTTIPYSIAHSFTCRYMSHSSYSAETGCKTWRRNSATYWIVMTECSTKYAWKYFHSNCLFACLIPCLFTRLFGCTFFQPPSYW